MSQDIGHRPDLRLGPVRLSGWAASGPVGLRWVVVAVGVEEEFAEEFAGGGMDDPMPRSWMVCRYHACYHRY
jgi:hypothetical protein